jgi:hypothetical protein
MHANKLTPLTNYYATSFIMHHAQRFPVAMTYEPSFRTKFMLKFIEPLDMLLEVSKQLAFCAENAIAVLTETYL